MTQPPSGWPTGEPQDPSHGAWQQPPAPAAPSGWPQQQPAPGEWPAPQQSGAPVAWPQQPGTGQSGWYAPQPGPAQPSGPWEPLGPQGYRPQPPRPRSRGKLIASAVIVAALAGGGVATYIAVSDKNSTGAGSPREAVQSIVSDLNNSDLVGALDDLAPGERAALSRPTLGAVKEAKRLKVLQPSADPKKVNGVHFDAKHLTFADKTVTINDHIQIVQLTGGTLDFSADASKVPFTREFLDAAFPHALPAQSNGAVHIDIATVVRDRGGNRPIRIATQKVGGKWYPSIFYTIADAAAANRAPAASDAIAAVGASSPENAVKQLVTALLKADVTGAIVLLSPDEMAVLHDYGGLLIRNGGNYKPSNVTVKDLQLKTEQVGGGTTRVRLSSVTVVTGSGDESTVKVDGNCVEVTAQGQHKRMCTSDYVTQILNFLTGFGPAKDVTPAQRQALEDLLTGLTRVGVDTTQSGGQWYVNPVRSWLEVSTSVLSGLRDNDLLELIAFFAKLGN